MIMLSITTFSGVVEGYLGIILELCDFRSHVHPELDTLTWPNGADFAPDYLYEKAKQAA
jgi:hypothetical protein